MLKAVRQSMIDEGLARTTINGAAGRIRRMFRWAVGDGNELVPASVLAGLEAVTDLQFGRSAARETAPVKPVDDAWIKAIRPHVTRQVWGLIQFQLTTGARPGEALIVRGCDLNTSGKIWEYRPSVHKTEHHGKSRVVFIGPQGQAVLKEFLTTDLQRYLFCPRDAVTEMVAANYREGAKVRQDIGERYTLHSYAAAIRRACEKAFGMPRQLRDIAGAVKKFSEAERKAKRVELSAATRR
jgi:integrase